MLASSALKYCDSDFWSVIREVVMANTKAAVKYLRQSQKRRVRNRQQRSTLRTQLKSFRALIADGPSQEDADKAFSGVAKALDQAAAKNLIHKNAASRTKSRLASLKKSALTGN